MNRRTFWLLLAALLVLAAIASVIDLGSRPAQTENALLYPGLAKSLNDVSRVVVTGAGGKVIATLDRSANGWKLAERNGYPANVSRIRKNLISLSEARLAEEKTSLPEYYDKLGVDDVKKADARGLQVEVTTPAGKSAVIVGDTNVGGADRAYIRRVGEPKSWLVTGQFDLGRTTGEWLDRELLDIPATRIHAVTIVHPGTDTLRIEKPQRDAADFAVVGIPPGRKLAYDGVANSVGAALATLQLDDVGDRRALSDNPGKPVVARFETFDGLVIEASAWRVPDGTRLTFGASTDRKLADRFAPPAPKPGDKVTVPAPADAPKSFDEVSKEAAALNARLGGFVYTLPSFKTEQFTKRLQDLLAPPG